ncbi:MAG: glycoside hydrolase family 1 protein [Pigmentiphaga sp.]
MIDRRALIRQAGVAAVLSQAPASAFARPAKRTFPKGFLWGTSTSAHQIEGNTVNSDLWFIETIEPQTFTDRVGDADDSYHRWNEDIALMKLMGLNTYRFSIEWSRIEPDRGQFSQAEIDHYKRFTTALLEAGIKPVVTFLHVSAPRWFAAMGGWLNPEAPALFARFCDYAARQLKGTMAYACTINEPQVALTYRMVPGADAYFKDADALQFAAHENAARKLGVERFITLNHPAIREMTPNLMQAHKSAYAAIKAADGAVPTGVTLNLIDFQPATDSADVAGIMQAAYGPWMEAAKTGDFVGVQTYRQMQVPGTGAKLPPPPAMPFVDPADRREVVKQPSALRNMVTYAHEQTGLPVFVTENGIETENDARREWYIPQVLGELHKAIAQGVPVLGYCHWSLIDNFEWLAGYAMKFGLASVDRKTFVRTPKPSAQVYAGIVRANAI